ncbi:MAG: trypsin-like peptidase domain-containing protein [Haloarculaceae archaeon]
MSENTRTRRSLLAAAAGAGIALAGCSGTVPDGTAEDTPTEDTEASAGTADGADASGSPGVSSRSSEPYVDLYRQLIDSVVVVRGYDGSGRAGQGSGFVAFDGTVVTNQHVVEGADELFVGFTGGENRPGELLGTDVYADLAAIEVDRPEGATPLPFVESEPPVGTRVAAVGAPFGLGESVSSGIISGVDRSLPSVNDFSIPDAVQTNAAVNPGNSGGPLATLDGRVAGVITRGGGENIAFGISAAYTRRVVPALVEDGEYDHPFMGVGLLDVTPALARANGYERSTGVYVSTVLDDGPAEGTLRGSTGSASALGVTDVPTGGDLVVGLDGRRIRSLSALSTYLALETSSGDLLGVTVVRDGERRSPSFELGERPEP